MITNFERYEGIALWCLIDDEDGIIGYFKTEKALLNYCKRYKIKGFTYAQESVC